MKLAISPWLRPNWVKLWNKLVLSADVVPPWMSYWVPLGFTMVPVLSVAGTIDCACTLRKQTDIPNARCGRAKSKKAIDFDLFLLTFPFCRANNNLILLTIDFIRPLLKGNTFLKSLDFSTLAFGATFALEAVLKWLQAFVYSVWTV
jgi:hypothetical protein